MTRQADTPRVIVRCDAGITIGGGHALRCLTLANELAGQGVAVTFVAASMPASLIGQITGAGHAIRQIAASPGLLREGPGWEEPALGADAQRADAEMTGAAGGRVDWAIVDHYLLDAAWHTAARGFADRILVIDDLANRFYDCDCLLDQTFGRSAADYRDRVPAGAAILAGADHALLRPEFARERPAALARRDAGGPVRRVLVSMGTADPGGITAQVTQQVLAAGTGWTVDVVVGPQATTLGALQALAAGNDRIVIHTSSGRMAELLRDADLAIGAGGMSALERCCLGLPSIILCLADNQRANAAALAGSGAALMAASPAEAALLLAGLGRDRAARIAAAKAAMAIADGLGAGRVVDACGPWEAREGA